MREPSPQLRRNHSPTTRNATCWVFTTAHETDTSATITGRYGICRCACFASMQLKSKQTAHKPPHGSCLERWTSLRVHLPGRTKNVGIGACHTSLCRLEWRCCTAADAKIYSLYFHCTRPHHNMIRAGGVATSAVFRSVAISRLCFAGRATRPRSYLVHAESVREQRRGRPPWSHNPR